MNSMQRTMTSMQQQEPDRVPLFLFPTLHGAAELGLTLKEYFSTPRYIVEAQLRLQKKLRNDCVTAYPYAAIEFEAWGGETVFFDDGPPNTGAPVLRAADMARLQVPKLEDCAGLQRVLETTRMLKARVGDEIPIVGTVISPFSLPIMQMGFENYLLLMHEDAQGFAQLMEANIAFTVAWANAQLAAGATAIGYADPASSTTISPRATYLRYGQVIAKRTLAQIKGATATHMASGRCMEILEDIIATGTHAIGISMLDDLAQLKGAVKGRVTLIGNLNGIAMRRWTAADAETAVKSAIAQAGRGGGFILSDNHGEIPLQVPLEVLMAVAEAVECWGRYPLDWIDGEGEEKGAVA